ncbi:hypothetical protein DPMN_000828 [Dreissena polymorpha]|uniref:Uncharacterized protein n=1 Tax=Dreissena polymorpha TaxID=45954 RepID=A0A9D4RSD7_DREPO|nr:hypothetical protein DPMN_000828 [Dreissena polymorpha]
MLHVKFNVYKLFTDRQTDGRTDGRRTLSDHNSSPRAIAQAQNIIGINLLTKFHEDRKINVASRVKNAPPPGSHVFQPTGIIFELFHDIIAMNLLTKKNAPPLGSHFFQANIIIFKLIQDIIETDLQTKFHEDWK